MDELVANLLKDVIQSIDTMLQSASTALQGGGVWDTAWTTVSGWSAALRPFCNIVIGICLLVEIAQVAAKVDIIKWEHGLKLCVKAALARVAIDIAPTFLLACYRQAIIWINALGGGGTTIGGLVNPSNIDTLTSGLGFIEALGLLASTLLIIIAIKVCGLLVQVMAYGRMFEIYVYLMVAPFPFAFFPLGNGNGDGISRITQRFIKSFIAVCLQGVMIFDVVMQQILTQAVAEALANADHSVAISNLCYSMLMGIIVLVMSVARCGSWAKGIIDAM